MRLSFQSLIKMTKNKKIRKNETHLRKIEWKENENVRNIKVCFGKV